jgi:two-component system, NtrC family, response regulator AtoC
MNSRGNGDEQTHTMRLEEEAAPARCVFVFWPGGAATYELPVRGALMIGRSSDCAIHIDHPSVSRRHAALHVDDGIYVEDQGSSNGTRIGGRRLEPKQRTLLPQGALVEVGLATAIVQRSASISTQATGARPAMIEGDARGARPTMDRLDQLVALVAPARISVILLGETGVGKEVMAERLHHLSPRAQRPLVRLNCAALPEPILESELFGHERGAFTGAVQRKVGLLESADGGTVFLDEVGELPLTTQAKLLRVLESREVTPVGSVTSRPIDVRFIAATNRDLDALVARGAFRSDLYYRLQGITLRIPPLRDRRGEIPGLVRTFVTSFSRATDHAEPTVSEAAMQRLVAGDWPGNIRELRNVIERAVVLSAGMPIDVLHLADMPMPIPAPAPIPAPTPPAMVFDAPPPSTATTAVLKEQVESLERQRIVEALQQSGGNQTEAAKLLGISRRMMLGRLDAYGLPRPRKR